MGYVVHTETMKSYLLSRYAYFILLSFFSGSRKLFFICCGVRAVDLTTCCCLFIVCVFVYCLLFVCLFVVLRRLVLFADREGADRAVRELNGTELDGRKIFLRKVWVSC